MTLQQYIESISRLFPDKGQTEIALDVNNTVRDFCEKTRILNSGVWNFTVTSGTVTGTDETRPTPDALTIVQPVDQNNYFSVALPSNVISFGEIRPYDSDSSLIQTDLSYNVFDNELRVYGAVPSDGVTESGAFANVASIELEVAVYPATLTDLDDVPEIPVDYHRGIESAVLALYYRRSPILSQGGQGGQYAVNINLAREFELEYERYVVRGKKYHFTNHQMGQTVADGWNY